MLINGEGRRRQEAARQARGVTGTSTWLEDGLNALVIALDEPSKGAIEDGTEIQQARCEAVRWLNVGKVEVTYTLQGGPRKVRPICFTAHILYGVSKKCATWCLIITLANMDQFSFFFTNWFARKFPPYLQYAATLPCEIRKSSLTPPLIFVILQEHFAPNTTVVVLSSVASKTVGTSGEWETLKHIINC